MLGPTELLIVLGIVMLLFGSTRLPKLAKSLGEAQRELRTATGDFEPMPTPQAAVEAKKESSSA